MLDNSRDFIGMPPASNATPNGDKLSDTHMADPRGNVVDNSSGINLADGREGGKPIFPTRGATGHSFNMYSKPSFLCH
jgi:hypothetical protein